MPANKTIDVKAITISQQPSMLIPNALPQGNYTGMSFDDSVTLEDAGSNVRVKVSGTGSGMAVVFNRPDATTGRLSIRSNRRANQSIGDIRSIGTTNLSSTTNHGARTDVIFGNFPTGFVGGEFITFGMDDKPDFTVVFEAEDQSLSQVAARVNAAAVAAGNDPSVPFMLPDDDFDPEAAYRFHAKFQVRVYTGDLIDPPPVPAEDVLNIYYVELPYGWEVSNGAVGDYSTVSGGNNVAATGEGAICIGGLDSYADNFVGAGGGGGDFEHPAIAGGRFNSAEGGSMCVGGSINLAKNTSPFIGPAFGLGSIVGSLNSICTDGHIWGGFFNQIIPDPNDAPGSSPYLATILGGQANVIVGNAGSSLLAGDANQIFSTPGSGVAAGCIALGSNLNAGGGPGCVAIGSGCFSVSSFASVAIGLDCLALERGAFACGEGSQVYGRGGFATNYAIAIADYSSAFGGSASHATREFQQSISGDTTSLHPMGQKALLPLLAKTVGAQTVNLTPSKAVYDGTEFAAEDGKSYVFTITTIGSKTNAPASDPVMDKRIITAFASGGTLTITQNTPIDSFSPAGTSVVWSAPSGLTLRGEVTGDAGANRTWTCFMEWVEGPSATT